MAVIPDVARQPCDVCDRGIGSYHNLGFIHTCMHAAHTHTHTHTHTHPFYGPLDFVRYYPGVPVPEPF